MNHLKEVLGTRCSVTVYMILLNIFGTLVDMMSFLVAPNVVGKSDERKGLAQFTVKDLKDSSVPIRRHVSPVDTGLRLLMMTCTCSSFNWLN